MIKKEIGKRLKMLRESKGMTQQAVADVLEIAKNTYAHYEDGSNEPRINIIVKIAQYYGITVDWLLGTGEYEKNPPPVDRWEVIRKTLETFSDDELKEVLSFVRFIEWKMNQK